MSDLRQAAMLALDALEHADKDGFWREQRDAITALRTALEQQQAEPVGEVIDERGEVDYISYVPPVGTALYTAQPQRKPLTDEEIEQAQRDVWRSLPSDFDYTTSSWIEIGIRYAEAAHGIKENT